MNLLNKASDPSFWNKVREEEYYKPFIANLMSVWDELCENRDFPDLPYSKYTLFFTEGDREVYERPYFERRRILNVSAMLSLIYPDEDKYFSKLQDAIFCVCNEYTWCLPAHVYAHGHGSHEPYIVDLFAAQTGFSLAEIYVLLSGRMDGVISNLLLSETKRRTVDATIANADKWWWETSTNNWSAICGGCIGCIAMLLCPEKLADLKPRIDSAMEFYISGFLGEGMCVEGLNYWDFGFGYFTVYADMLYDYTEEREDYFARDDVKRIAAFPSKVMLTGNVVASFSDASLTASLSRGIVHYLRDKYSGSVTMPGDKYCIDNSQSDRFAYMLRSVLWTEKPYGKTDDEKNEFGYFYAEKSQWYVNKSSQISFAAKGGHNNEPHNHNDIGSFIVAYDGRQIFADVGKGRYTADYFGDKRYLSFEPSSSSHSLPIIDGKGQLPGECYKARDVVATDSLFTLDIAGAYGNPDVVSLRRRFELTEAKVTLTDSFQLKKDLPITERFVTFTEPQLYDGTLLVDGAMVGYSDGASEVRVTKRTTYLGGCYLIDFVLSAGAKSFKLWIKRI
ncbi:MAG: heparinase II/III family protein [Clostridia bacterium]|nr:heparinase II/III family protein [Clostridia bacterium]